MGRVVHKEEGLVIAGGAVSWHTGEGFGQRRAVAVSWHGGKAEVGAPRWLRDWARGVHSGMFTCGCGGC